MTQESQVARPARAPRPRTQGAAPMAFAFTDVQSPAYAVSAVTWTPAAQAVLAALRASLQPHRETLPVRALRHRLQVRDAQVLRIDRDFGFKGALLVSAAEPDVAGRAANDSVADWAQEALRPMKQLAPEPAAQLRRLALRGEAVTAARRDTALYQWRAANTGSALPSSSSQFADLADAAALTLTGKEIYPGAGPLRRVVGADLQSNAAELMTDVITLDVRGTPVRFSLGLTLSVETYPGRPLPVVQLQHKKYVWAREPRAGRDALSGYVLPAGEARALRFSVLGSLALTEEYVGLARAYGLPFEHLSAADLAAQGTGFAHPVVITHRNGRAEGDAALRGVTDLDRQLSFERAAAALEPLGLHPWTAVAEIPTLYKQQSDADMDWKAAFGEAPDDLGALEPAAQRRVQDAERNFVAWAERMGASIRAHYAGTYRLVLGFQEGLQADAVQAAQILRRVLGDLVDVQLEALPPGVHGPRDRADLRPAQRAALRAEAWAPFVARVRELRAQGEVHGALIMARQWYSGGHDDVVSKRAARVTLSRELGLTTQYLLPPKLKRDGTPTANAGRDFQIRTVNAWRDLAWKSLGKMTGIDAQLRRSVGRDVHLPPRILGVGILRTNSVGFRANEASFIPYAIELDPVTGVCVGCVRLQGPRGAWTTPVLPLPELVQELTRTGPSRLGTARGAELNAQRREEVQAFVHEVIAARAALCPELIVLLDGKTLSGMWPWLSDAKIDPQSVELGREPHAEADFPRAALVRLRADHAPKVIMETKQVRVQVDGKLRPSATWSSADLYRVTDTPAALPTYFSFGSRIFKPVRGASAYREVGNAQGEPVAPYTDAWLTPNAVEVTVTRRGAFEADDLAKLIEALRSEYAHFGSWTTLPGPLHFGSFLKEYVPDYDLSEEDED